jgi:hypothetical protein
VELVGHEKQASCWFKRRFSATSNVMLYPIDKKAKQSILYLCGGLTVI